MKFYTDLPRNCGDFQWPLYLASFDKGQDLWIKGVKKCAVCWCWGAKYGEPGCAGFHIVLKNDQECIIFPRKTGSEVVWGEDRVQKDE